MEQNTFDSFSKQNYSLKTTANIEFYQQMNNKQSNYNIFSTQPSDNIKKTSQSSSSNSYPYGIMEGEDKIAECRKNYSKWNNQDKKIYWFSLLLIADQNPLVKLSWENWKIDRCFKKMEKFFKGRKTNTQIKSFDQRMKKQYMKDKNIDLMDAILQALSRLSLTEEEERRLKKMSEKTTAIQIEAIAKYFEQQVIPQCQRDLQQMQTEYKKFFHL